MEEARCLVYASSNPGKIAEVARHFAPHDIPVHSMRDLGAPSLDVPETGITLGDNAQLKVRAYIGELSGIGRLHGKRIIVLSDDTGLEIKELGGEPGIHVRRWKDGKTRMSDEQIIDHALARMRKLRGKVQRAAQFRTVIAASVLYEDGRTIEPQLFSGKLQGHILSQPDTRVPSVEGFPFAQLFYVEDWKMVLGKVYTLPEHEKAKYLSHRERAIENAMTFVRYRYYN